VEHALAAIRDPAGEGERTFIAVHEESALAAADRIDALRRQGATLPVLAGLPISIKDNIDEAGHMTLAGSSVLVDAPPAARDAAIVARLREAGAVIVGRTNMTEFAYSGLGINPHYGTPRNTFDRSSARLPGGSSSGAAISITDGMASAAIGTDTGGSVRIPAALNGLVGFKPTAHRVPLEGVLPLSMTLDSAGPIARTVADCVLLDHVLTQHAESDLPLTELRGLRFAVPQTIAIEDLSPAVATAFTAALARLSAAGATIVDAPLTELRQAASINPSGALVSAEAFAWHRPWLERGGDKYDPRVLIRIRPGAALAASDLAELLERRREFVAAMDLAAREYDALLLPTTPETAPPIADVLKDDASYFHYNGRMLRNPALVNLFDGCALSIPCHEPGSAPVGLMIAGTSDADRRILAIGQAVETALMSKAAPARPR
jgi:aspartyl-tRNA(Asn)/glutamyl-tRNA(Gln) amidotransferase subunit A